MYSGYLDLATKFKLAVGIKHLVRELAENQEKMPWYIIKNQLFLS